MPSSWTATRNREEVERMSLEGAPVQQIADALGISYGYVIELRGQIGIGKHH